MGVGRLRLVRNRARLEDERGDGQTRAPGWQQEAVAHLGQRALAGAPLPALMDDAVAMVARILDVDYAGLLEYRPEGARLVGDDPLQRALGRLARLLSRVWGHERAGKLVNVAEGAR